jgi:hypothetical protein
MEAQGVEPEPGPTAVAVLSGATAGGGIRLAGQAVERLAGRLAKGPEAKGR